MNVKHLGLAALVVLAALGLWRFENSQATTSSQRLDAETARVYGEARYLLDSVRPGSSGRALQRFEIVLDQAPDSAMALAGAARASQQLGQELHAETFAHRAIEVDPRSLEAHLVLAGLAIDRGLLEEAERRIDSAHDIDPSNAHVALMRGFSLIVQGKQRQATAWAERALELDPASALVSGDVGYFFLWSGEYARAASVCGAAVELEPEFHAALECALRANDLLGETDSALLAASGLVRLHSREGGEQLPPLRDLDEYYRWQQQRLERSPPGSAGLTLARIHARNGDLEASLRELEALQLASSGNRRWLYIARVDPEFISLRTEARFLEIGRRADHG